MAEIESHSKKATEEINLLRANLEKEKASIDDDDDGIKMKDDEIRSLTLTIRISVENATTLHKNNQQLEQDIQELKMKNKTSSKDSELPYPCVQW